MTPETWAAVEILLWLGGIGIGLLIGVVLYIYNLKV
tara:strand:- start:1469 stop:1576 length:108 start_codon:yes stop_codon:yes gene_type:complete